MNTICMCMYQLDGGLGKTSHTECKKKSKQVLISRTEQILYHGDGKYAKVRKKKWYRCLVGRYK